VADDEFERTLFSRELLGGSDPIAHIGAGAGGVAVCGRVERMNAESLGDEVAHQGRKLRHPAVPPVHEQCRARAGAPLIGLQAVPAHVDHVASRGVVRGVIIGAHAHARTCREEERKGEAPSDRGRCGGDEADADGGELHGCRHELLLSIRTIVHRLSERSFVD
jgi:hypothetical protein